jgi:hypothetical protein
MPTPLPTIEGAYYAHLQMVYNSLPSGNIFTWSAGPGVVTPEEDYALALDIATYMAASWLDTLMPLYPDSVHGQRVRVYALGHPLVPAAEAPLVGTGGTASTMAPVSAAAVIKHTVVRRGRGSQSHSAISPLATSKITGDGTSLTDAAQLSFSEEFGDFIGEVQAAWIAAHPEEALAYVQLSKKGAGAIYPITGSACEKLLGTERSRTPRP